MSVNYRILGKRNKLIRDYYKADCFADISNINYLPKETYSIIVYLPTSIIISEDKLKTYIKNLAKMRFPCKYLGIKPLRVNNKIYVYNQGWTDNFEVHDFYYISVPIQNKHGLIYKRKDHWFATLTLIRYLLEYPSVVDTYFDICKAVGKRVNKFKALQIANMYYGTGSGHQIFYVGGPQRWFKPKTLTEVLTSFGNSTIKTFSKERTNLHSHFKYTALDIEFSKSGNFKTIYNSIMKAETLKTKVYVVGGAEHYANWLPDIKLVDNVESSDVVLFTGGEDVHPSFYGETVGEYTSTNIERDKREKEIFDKARLLGKKFLGICRGSQFLCVMAGGKLVQHQNNPNYEHKILTDTGQEFNITSTHHQAQYPFNMMSYRYRIMAWSLEKQSDFHLNGEGIELNPQKECEIVWYQNIYALCIQGHPEHLEYQRNPDNKASLEYLKKLFTSYLAKK